MSRNDGDLKDLILAFQGTGSKGIFETLYDRFELFVYRKCLLITGSGTDAQDIAQEVWIKVYFGLEKFRFESGFAAWLGRITVNTCLNYSRKKGRMVAEDNPGEMENGSLPDPDDKIDVTKLLSRLSIETRALVVMKYMDGLSYEEISEITGAGLSAVKMKISRAKKDLLRFALPENDDT